ncbi:MAG: hypothetical protein Q7T87_17460 [Polaromonas sp.]|nr:hypothetical protein [Polaromonas sp.]
MKFLEEKWRHSFWMLDSGMALVDRGTASPGFKTLALPDGNG